MTNDQLYQKVSAELRSLAPDSPTARANAAKVNEAVHLLDAYNNGENILLAKLAYERNEARPSKYAVARHLGDEWVADWPNAEAVITNDYITIYNEVGQICARFGL